MSNDTETTVPDINDVIDEAALTTIERLQRALDEASTFLDRLPVQAAVVSGGERMKGASEAELQAWTWGIEDTVENVKRLISEWRSRSND